MVIVNWEILWGCCTFHSLQGEHWPYTIFLFLLCHSPWLFPKAFYYGWRKNWSKRPITPPCNFEKLPDKKSETHTVVVALHFVSQRFVLAFCCLFWCLSMSTFTLFTRFWWMQELLRRVWAAMCELLVESFIVLLSSKTWYDWASLH